MNPGKKPPSGRHYDNVHGKPFLFFDFRAGRLPETVYFLSKVRQATQTNRFRFGHTIMSNVSPEPAPSDSSAANSQAAESADGTQLQKEFYEAIGPIQQFHALYDRMPGVFFFAKDQHGRMIAASKGIVGRLGLKSEAELVGTTDYDHFPKHVADAFADDDQQVLETGQPILNRVEIWYTAQRLLDWFVTNKLPITDQAGETIGVMGIVTSYEGHRKFSLPYTQISRVVDHIRLHHRGKITVAELAELAELSTRQLHRKFIEVFGMNAQDFLSKTRIQGTCDALVNTEQSIIEIAHDFGFCDQSAFTQQFKKHVGTTPLKFRRNHQFRNI